MSDVAQAIPAGEPFQAAKPDLPSQPAAKAGVGLGLMLLYLLVLTGVPTLCRSGYLQVETVTMLGRFMAFAIVAISLDLLWGYTGILCLCQSLFFALGGYAMGMYLAIPGRWTPPAIRN